MMNRRHLNMPCNGIPDDRSEVCHSDPAELTLIEALDTIQTASDHSKLSDRLWEECRHEFEFLRSHTGLNNRQLVILARLCEAGSGLSWRSLGQGLGLSRLRTMSLSEDIEDMKGKRWILPYSCDEFGTRFEGFRQAPGVIKAFRENRDYVPEVLDGFSEQAFVDRLVCYVSTEGSHDFIPNSGKHWWLIHFAQCNPQLPLCEAVLELEDEMSKVILLWFVADYAVYAGEPNEGLCLNEFYNIFDEGWALSSCMRNLRNDTHELICEGLIEHACTEDGMADQERFRLTRKAKEDLLPEYVQVKKPLKRKKQSSGRDLLRAESIKQKQIYYDPEMDRQIDRISALLSRDGLTRVQERLESLGHRKGICCLFYGSPGTGKTETALQLARQTGRDVMMVNIAGIRDKYVGETEKNIKGIFSRYKALCEESQVQPILLFNEADAIINSRLETVQSSVEKMDNAMQNIILQEMEDLDGILIATTNLTGTLDKAFDRRFLFKVEFTRPSINTKSAIWHDKLPELDTEETMHLAREFDFSGGQIENIARKCEIDYIITGSRPSMEDIIGLCREEYLNRSNKTKVGFNHAV